MFRMRQAQFFPIACCDIFPPFPLLGFQIHYWEMDNQNETEKVKILFLPETSLRLKNLTSYTYYMVKLSAFNAAGDGPLSEPRRGRTLQSGQALPYCLTCSINHESPEKSQYTSVCVCFISPE